MLLRSALARQGQFLFRWRSYLPLALLPLLLAALGDSVRIETWLGETWSHGLSFAGMAVAFSGLALRWATVGYVPAGTSGRNTRAQRADRLNTTGLYATCRNPLYLGNGLTILGIVATTGVWWLMVAIGLAYGLYIERIIAAEEAYLETKFGQRYRDWAAVTPAFWPRFRNWRRPEMRFSLRTVLRREYNGLAATGLALLVTEAIKDLVFEGMAPRAWMREDLVWLSVAALVLAAFVILRTLKKKTTLLRVTGR